MGVLLHPDEPATKKQTFMIYSLGGGDVREQNLNRAAAKELIEKLLVEKESGKNTVSIPEKNSVISYEKIMAEATEAASAAGDAWMAKATPQFRVVERSNPLDDNSPIVKDFGTMLDVCGFAGIEIKDKRTKFAKWLVQKYNWTYSVRIDHKYRMRQELGLAENCAKAALDVFRKHGVDKGLQFYSRID